MDLDDGSYTRVQLTWDSLLKGREASTLLEFRFILSVPVIQWAMTARTFVINLLTDEVIYEIWHG